MSGAIFGRRIGQETAISEAAPSSGSSIFRSLSQQQAPVSTEQSPEADYDLPDEFADRLFEQGVAKTYARIGEGAAGVPGNLANLANKLTGGKLPGVKSVAKVLPTTEDIKKFTGKYGGEYLKEDEEGIGKIAGDFLTNVGSYAVPLGKVNLLDKANKALSGYRFLSPVISPALGEGAKATVKKLGGSESAQELAGVSLMVVNDVLSNRGKGSDGYINQLYKKSLSSVPAGTKQNANKFAQALENTRKKIMSGGMDPTKEKPMQQIDNLLKRLSKKGKNYSIDPTEFAEMRKSVNNMVDSLGGFSSELTHRGRRTAVGHLNDVRKDVIDAGMEYGNRANPEFAKYWDAANEAYRVKAKSEVVMRTLEKFIPQKMLNRILSAVTTGTVVHKGIGAALSSATKGAAIGAPLAVAGKGIYEVGKIAYRASKSPTLRKYYTSLMKAAVQQDSKAIAHYSGKIDAELKAEEEKEKSLIRKSLGD